MKTIFGLPLLLVVGAVFNLIGLCLFTIFRNKTKLAEQGAKDIVESLEKRAVVSRQWRTWWTILLILGTSAMLLSIFIKK